MISTEVKWEIYPTAKFRKHIITIDWKEVSDAINFSWDDKNYVSSYISFQGDVAIQNAKIELFDKEKDITEDIYREEKGDIVLTTKIKINLKKFDKEFNLFKKNNFQTIITFNEGRTVDLKREWTIEKLDFKPRLFSNSYDITFNLPKIPTSKWILFNIFRISDRTDYDIVWDPIDNFDPEINKERISFLLTERSVGIQKLWYTLPKINYTKLLVRVVGIIVIAFIRDIPQFILNIWSAKP